MESDPCTYKWRVIMIRANISYLSDPVIYILLPNDEERNKERKRLLLLWSKGRGYICRMMAQKHEDLNALASESLQEPFITAWPLPWHVPIFYFVSKEQRGWKGRALRMVYLRMLTYHSPLIERDSLFSGSHLKNVSGEGNSSNKMCNPYQFSKEAIKATKITWLLR